MKKILLIDDDILKKALKIMLKPLGYEIILADDGEEGLKQVDEHGEDISLIFLDMMMPGMDGLRFLKILKEERKMNTPVIALSSVNDPDHIHKVLKAGAHDYCVKPAKAEELKKRALKILGN